LFDAMSLSILPRPNTGQQSPITTGPLRRAHLTTTRSAHCPGHAPEQHLPGSRPETARDGLCWSGALSDLLQDNAIHLNPAPATKVSGFAHISVGRTRWCGAGPQNRQLARQTSLTELRVEGGDRTGRRTDPQLLSDLAPASQVWVRAIRLPTSSSQTIAHT
jgi:hypothetical protein